MSARAMLSAMLLLACAPAVRAGFSPPCYIDGCQSADGRFVVTAEAVVRKGTHGPNSWRFTWKDTRTGETRSFDAQGVQGGQIYAQLFMAPDGETFALFNHVTLFWTGKSADHAGDEYREKHGAEPGYRRSEPFSNRIIIYRKDGTILKTLGIADILAEDEQGFQVVFNRAHWCRDYPGLNHRTTPRPAYALCQVSPDYTMIEFMVLPPRDAKGPAGMPAKERRRRVSLTDGRVLPDDEVIADPQKVPVRPFVGDAAIPAPIKAWGLRFVPSLDPVRIAGTWRDAPTTPGAQAGEDAEPEPKPEAEPARAAAPAEIARPQAQPAADRAPAPVVRKLFTGTKLDTPAWLVGSRCLVFTDLDRGKLHRLDPPDAVSVAREGASRGKAGPDGRLYGVFGAAICTWTPGEEPRVVIGKAAGGREISLNDLAVAPDGRRLYFSTLKDPDKGRLSVVDIAAGTVRVLFDGEQEPLCNPNGVAVSPDGKHLHVVISSYKDRGRVGVYRFPILDDGGIDVAAGAAKPWAKVTSPDGIAFGPGGRLYANSGEQVVLLDAEGRTTDRIKVGGGSGTNLCFGGSDGRTLYVTTNSTLFAVEQPAAR